MLWVIILSLLMSSFFVKSPSCCLCPNLFLSIPLLSPSPSLPFSLSLCLPLSLTTFSLPPYLLFSTLPPSLHPPSLSFISLFCLCAVPVPVHPSLRAERADVARHHHLRQVRGPVLAAGSNPAAGRHHDQRGRCSRAAQCAFRLTHARAARWGSSHVGHAGLYCV